jgi:multiple sugar transport system substrate-binding protein
MTRSRGQFSRRRFLASLGVLSGTAVLAACGATPTPQVIEKVVEKEVTKIVEGTPQVVKETVVITETQVVEKVVKETVVVGQEFVTLKAPYAPGYIVERQMFDKFEELEPNIKVLAEEVPGGTKGYEERTMADMAAGILPDVWYVHPNFFSMLASREALMEIDSFMAADADFPKDNLFEAAYTRFSWEGVHYGLPYACNTQYYVYNKRLLAEKGLQDLKERYSAGDWNWDALLETAIGATSGDGPDMTMGLWSTGLTHLNYVNAWIWAAGGDVFDEGLKTCLLDSPEATEALQFVVDLYAKHKVSPLGPTEELFPDGFFTDRVAMDQGGRWQFEQLGEMDNPLDVGVVPYPQGPSGQGFARGGWDGFAVPKGSPHPNESWKLLRFLVSDDAQMIMMASSMPFTHSVFDSDAFAQSLQPGEDLEVYKASVAMHRNMTFPKNFPEVNKAYGSEIEGAQLGQVPVDQAIANIVAQANELLAQA